MNMVWHMHFNPKKRRSRALACVVAPLSCISFLGVVEAQTRNQRQALEEVIVTAQKREERLQDVPISITVLGGDELDNSSIAGVNEALNRVPGVVAPSGGIGGGGNQVSIRGVGASGAVENGASPVGYYVDSVPFTQIRQALVPDLYAFDLERIEVLRGPQGTLYGVNAENDLIRVLTRDTDLDAFGFKARTTVSSTERGSENYRGDVMLNVPIVEGKLGARAVVDYQNMSGWIDQVNKEDINDAEMRTYRLKVNARPTEALSMALSAWSSKEDRGGPSVAPDSGLAPFIADQPGATDYESYSFKLDYAFSAFAVSSMTSYYDYDNRTVFDYAGFVPVLAGFVQRGQHLSKTFAQEVLVRSTQEGPWKWSAGAFYRDTADRMLIVAQVFWYHD